MNPALVSILSALGIEVSFRRRVLRCRNSKFIEVVAWVAFLIISMLLVMGNFHSLYAASPQILYVAPFGIDGGECTMAQPCLTIQAAVDTAADGDEVRVAAGEYIGVGATSEPVVKVTKSLTLRGGYSASNWVTPDPALNPTVVDGGGVGGRRGILIVTNPEGAPVTISGFEIRNCSGDTGGGVFNVNGDVTLEQCHIHHNFAQDYGGGVSSAAGALVLRRNDLHHNESDYGGALNISGGSSIVEMNRFYLNEADFGAFSVIGGDIEFRNNLLYNNEVTDWGGGIYVDSGTIAIENSTFYGNTALEGGGIYVYDGAVAITNTLFVSNTASVGDVIEVDQGQATVGYCDFFGNSPESSSYCGADDNYCRDPQLSDAANADFRLVPSSPAIDSGADLVAVTEDVDGRGRPYGAGWDRGAHEYMPDSDCYARPENGPVFTTIQDAVDAADPGDVVQIAGVCRGATAGWSYTQTVYLDKGLTLRGAYTATDWQTARYGPTVLDADGAGRVLSIFATELVALENLHLTGGVADYGGGIYAAPSSLSLLLQNTVVYGNHAVFDGGGFYNGGAATVDFCVFYGNTAGRRGGGIYAVTDMTLRNSVIANNSAQTNGGGLYQSTPDKILGDYNAYDDNFVDSILSHYGNVTVGANDVLVDPHFVDAANGDFHLLFESPLINRADPLATLTQDFEGEPRPGGDISDIGVDERHSFAAVVISDADPVIETDFENELQGQTFTFIHTITNTGYTPTLTDIYDITIVNSAGWPTNVAPSQLEGIPLDLGQGYTFELGVTVPATQTRGFYNTTSITVTSRTSPEAYATTLDVIANPGLIFTPSYSRTLDPGETVTYTHILNNVGPADVFTLTPTSSQGWGTLLDEGPFALGANESVEVRVELSVKPTAPAGLQDVTVIEATSQLFDVTAAVTDTTVAKATAGSRYVRPGGYDTNNNCTVPSDACRTVGHAVQQAVSGDAIYLAEGTYETGELILSKVVDLRAGYRYAGGKFEPVTEVIPARTVLDFGGGSRGIQVTAVGAGDGLTFSGFQIVRARTDGYGGGVLLQDAANARLHNLVIEDSSAARGGALYITRGRAVLEQVHIINARAQIGGALYNEGGVLVINGLTINHSLATAGAGGALFNAGAGDAWLANTLMYSNTATAGGGAIYNAGVLTALNNTLVGNRAGTLGGGLYDHASMGLTVRNTIFAGNAAGAGGGLYQAGPLVADADYNTFWDNTADSHSQRNLLPGPHDVDADPRFVDATLGDYHLTALSPCVDAGDPNTPLMDDIDGDPRPSNHGYDIGADELRGCRARVVDPVSLDQIGEIFNGLQQAVDFASEGDLIQVSGTCFGVNSHTFQEQVLSQTVFITKSLTLRGGYPATFEDEPEEPTYLDALGNGRVLYVTSPATSTVYLTLQRLTLQAGKTAVGQHGAIIFNDSGVDLRLEHVRIAGGETGVGGRGGGLYNQAGASVGLGETAFISNTAGYGGALYNLGAVSTFSSTLFTSNIAVGDGGALYNAATGDLQIDAATVLSNTAQRGGGFYNTASGALLLTNSLVVSNTAVLEGGGLYNLSTGLAARHDTFFSNWAQRGAAVYHDAGAGAVINSTLFVSNTNTTSDGGAVLFVVNAPPSFDYNGLWGNFPSNYSPPAFSPPATTILADPGFLSLDPESSQFLRIPGGSPMEDSGDPASPVFWDIDGTPRPSNQGFDIGADEVGDCYIRINGNLPTYGNVQRAIGFSQSGDVLHIAGTCLGVNPAIAGSDTVSQTAFIEHSLGLRGGYTVTNWTEPDPAVYTTTLDALGRGRVVYITDITDTPVVTVTGLHLRGGYAVNGGGIYAGGGVITLTQSHIYSHTATERGGGVYNVGATLALDGIFLHDNTANRGGGLYVAAGETWLQNTFVYRNAATDGAGVYNAGAGRLLIRNNTFYANTAATGGGLYTTNHAPVVSNNIFADNTGQGSAIYSALPAYARADYSGVRLVGGAFFNVNHGDHLIIADPGFVDSALDDFRLRDDSPMLDQGDPATTLLHDFEGDLRPADQGFDLGADERRGCWARIVRDAEIFGPFGNPQWAIDRSEPGDLIQVTVGECRGVHPYVDGPNTFKQTVHITHNLHLTGGYLRDFTKQVTNALSYPDAETSTIFNAGYLGRAVLIAHTSAVTIEEVNFARGDAALGGGLAQARGGAFYATEGQVSVALSGFYDSRADQGGALAFGGQRLLLDGIQVYSNTATSGGGLFIHTGAVTVTGNTLVGFNSSDMGGALYAYGGNVYVGAKVKFHDNTATEEGGAVYVRSNVNGALMLEGAILSGNSAVRGGGAFGESHSNLTVDLGTRLHSNEAQQGGAVYGGGNNFRVRNTLIYSNTAQQGAGVFIDHANNILGDPQIEHNTLIRNTATESGGGVYVAGSTGSPYIRNNIFEDNDAPNGSAIYAGHGVLSHNNYYALPVADQVAGGVQYGTVNYNYYPFYVAVPAWDDPDSLDKLDFHLDWYSPLIDVGLEVGVTYDMDGHPRPINGAPDIGADEYPDCLARISPDGPIFGRIQTAIDNAESGGIVDVAEGVCLETLDLNKDITIRGSFAKDFSSREADVITTWVNAEGVGPVAVVADAMAVSMSQIALSHGATDGNGGGLYISPDAHATLSGVSVSLCSASGHGGGVYVAARGALDATNLYMEDNEADGNGGAIYNAGLGALSVCGSTFWNNSAGGSGGAIYSASGATFTRLNNSSFRSSTAGQGTVVANGGALYNGSANLPLTNVGFLGNEATGSGGAVYNTGNGVLFEHNTVVGNFASEGRGDGIYNSGSDVRFNAGIVANNGTTEGEGIYSTSTQPLVLTYSLVWQNSLPDDVQATNQLNLAPLLRGLYPTYVSPAIDAVPSDQSILNYDHVVNYRPQICAKDMGYHEYSIGARELEPAVPDGRELAPGESYTYTVTLTNNSEEWVMLSDGKTSRGPGSGYTETVRVTWHSSRGWAAITAVDNVADLQITPQDDETGWADFKLAPGEKAFIRVAVNIRPGEFASVAGDPETREVTTLSYTTTDTDCRSPLAGVLDGIETTVAMDNRCLIGPEASSSLNPGETVSYTHVITNIGNITATYALAPGPGFYAVAEVSPTGIMTQSLAAVYLGPGEATTVTLRVTIRPEIAAGLTNITTLIGRVGGVAQCSVADHTSVLASQGIRYVAPSGVDSLVDETLGGNPDDPPDNNCTQPQISPCGTLRHALDQAQPGEELRVAAGIYTGTYTVMAQTAAYTQALYINKPVTITGGYQVSDWSAAPPDHHLHPSVLDAEFAGRVVYIATAQPVHLSRLTLQNGTATGQGGGPANEDAGGNLYNAGAPLSLDALRFTGGVGEVGGGLYSAGGALVLTNNLFYDNGTNSVGHVLEGGALYIESGDAHLLNNTLYRNSADRDGAALYQRGGTLTLRNTLIAEQATGNEESSPDGHHASVHVEPGVGYAADYNLWYSSAGVEHTSGIADVGSHPIEADPLVVDSDLPDLHLQSGSPAREAGDPGTRRDQFFWGVDYDNEPRIMGLVVDIGAYEFVVEPEFELAPDYRYEVYDPGTVLLYTHTLTNTGDYTDTFDLGWASSRDWILSLAPDTSVELAPDESRTLTFSGAVPLGAAGLVDRTVLTVTSSLGRGAYRTAVNETRASLNPGVVLAPTTQSGATDPGEAIAYTLTLTNTGDGADSFLLSITPLAGWTVDLIPDETPVLDPGAKTTLAVTLTPPLGTLSGVVEVVTVTAASSFDPAVIGQAQIATSINRVRSLAFAPDQQQSVTFEEAVTYAHTLTNTGNAPEMVHMTSDSSAGWAGAFLTPPVLPVEIGPGAAIPVVFELTVPPGSGGAVDVTTLTAFIPTTAVQATVVNTTTVIPDYNFELAPLAQSRNGVPGEVVVFTHMLTNTGNVTDTYAVSLTSARAGWMTYAPTSVLLEPRMTSTVILTVTLPLDAPGGAVGATVTVASQQKTGLTLSAEDVVTVVTGDQPIEGLEAFNDSPTEAGHVTALWATVQSGEVDTYSWAFDDGEIGSGMTVTHTYAVPGIYTAIVTATNATDFYTASTLVTITAPCAEVQIVSLESDSPVVLGETMQFTATVTGSAPITYTWDFGGPGDATDSATATPSYEYDAAGVYTVTLTASNPCGVAIDTRVVNVTSPGEQPITGLLAFNDSPTLLGQATTLTATITGGTSVSYTWAFGDGEGADGATVTYVYPARGLYTATVTATNALEPAVATTLVQVVSAGVALEPDQTRFAAVGATLTYTHRLTNTGDLPDTFTLTAHSSQMWPMVLSPTEVTLPAGGSAEIALSITVVPGSDQDTAVITATSQIDPTVFDTVTDTTLILLDEGVLLEPDHDGTVEPGASVVYTHYLTNTGGSLRRFLLQVQQDPVWQVELAPGPSVDLPPGASSRLTVTLTAPPDSLIGTVHTLYVLAIAENDEGIRAYAQDRTTVSQIFGVMLAPDRQGAGAPGTSVTYQHMLTNTGTGEDRFDLAYNSPSGWPVTVTPTSVQLAAGATAPVTVVVRIPAAASVGAEEVVSVSATSVGDPTQTHSVFDTTTVTGVEAFRLFLPLIIRNYSQPGPDLVVMDVSVVPPEPEAGQPVTLYVTVRNQGEVAVAYGNNFYVDLYVNREPQPLLTGDRSWGAQGSWFGVNQSYTFQGTYTFPAAGSYTLWAQADTDDTVVESREDNNISSPRVVGVSGAAPKRGSVPATPEATWGPRPTPTPSTP